MLTAAATFLLLGAGGLVTSHGVGMSVPDWPNTYGYNMFFFPLSRWVGGVFYEHSHRLLATGVGLMTAVLALWLYGKSSRPFLRWTGVVLLSLAALTWLAARQRWADGVVLAGAGAAAFSASWLWPRREASPRWLRRVGLTAFFAVVLQGVLGGLRVVLFKDQLGIFHATLAQLFFALSCALALFTSAWWERTSAKSKSPGVEVVGGPTASSWSTVFFASISDFRFQISNLASTRLHVCIVATTGLILLQLMLGATMRHQHAGLAIPDFPLAYGKLWPALDAHSVVQYNQQRVEVLDANPITAFQICLQMIHRLAALVIFGMVGWCAWLARRQFGRGPVTSRLAMAWLGVVLLQALLGAATIWTNKAADVATAHVLTGALALAVGVMLSLVWPREVSARAVLQPARGARQLASALGADWEVGPTTHPAPVAGIE